MVWCNGSGIARQAYLHDSARNRDTAFTAEERIRIGIDGLLPPSIESIETQASRVLCNVRARPTAIDKYRYLSALQRSNETLFYRVVLDHLEELLPIVYTPTVGQACLEWSTHYERPAGLYLTARHRGRIASVLRNWPRRDVRVIVVTDGGRILGLGDLGANGMGIPIGKLALYTLCAGIRPEMCLPITLDLGTDTRALLDDPMYLGTREARMRGTAWDDFLDEFIRAVEEVFPGSLVQFEDFNTAAAFRLLARYRDKLCCFNDDIQGTGAMGLAGLKCATRACGVDVTQQRILFAGAGEAGLGIGSMVITAMVCAGLPEPDAHGRCLFMDSKGLVVASRADLSAHKRPFAQHREWKADLLSAIEAFRPTALIGASGQPGLFTRPVLEAMARWNERPIVFALSNPLSKAECTAEQAYTFTGGRAIFAGGTAFAPVIVGGRTLVPGQGNNSLVFPGVGLGAMLSGTRRVTDEMFFAAAAAVASEVTESDLACGRVFPAASCLRAVAAKVAAAVAEVAYEQDMATEARPAHLLEHAASVMYQPRYGALESTAGARLTGMA
jgi:malate dehydrogenase (oxaloacetate-decarboxylating)(NADP+)